MNFNIQITFPDEILLSLRRENENIQQDMKETVAVKYYRERKLSLGQSAELAGMSKEKFIELLSTYNISIFSSDKMEDLLMDVENA